MVVIYLLITQLLTTFYYTFMIYNYVVTIYANSVPSISIHSLIKRIHFAIDRFFSELNDDTNKQLVFCWSELHIYICLFIYKSRLRHRHQLLATTECHLKKPGALNQSPANNRTNCIGKGIEQGTVAVKISNSNSLFAFGFFG